LFGCEHPPDRIIALDILRTPLAATFCLRLLLILLVPVERIELPTFGLQNLPMSCFSVSSQRGVTQS
jgi:hypothetical protein